MYRVKSLEITNLMSHELTKFEFRQGKAILVIGENFDDAAQFRNGSGKSALIEALAIALTGASIRDVKPRELVRDGQDYLESELILYNTMYNCELRIRRRLYASQNKSSVCQIWENNVEVTTCPDVNSYNKFILEKLDISREDLFSFYLVTKEMYEPFLSVGDVKKKQIINRFSGADEVDKTEPLIKLDSEKISTQIKDLENEKLRIETRSQLLAEQIQTLKDEQSLDVIQSKIDLLKKSNNEKCEALQERIRTSSDIVTTSTRNLQVIKDEKTRLSNLLKQAEEDQKNFKIDEEREQKVALVQKEITLSKTELLSIQDKLRSLVPDFFQKEVDNIEKEEKENTLARQETTKNRTQLLSEINLLEDKLQGAINCPKCEHEFTLRDKEFNVNVGKIELVKFQAILEDYNKELELYKEIDGILQEQKDDVNERVRKKREEIINSEKEIHERIRTLTNTINLLDLEKTEETSKLNRIKSQILLLQTQVKDQDTIYDQKLATIKQYEETIEDIKKQQADLIRQEELDIEELRKQDTKQIDELTRQIEELTQSLTKQSEAISLKIEEKSKIDSWLVNFKNFKSFLANQSISNIQDYTNLFLNRMGSDITIKLDGYRTLSSNKLKEEIQTVVYRRGFEEGSYGRFSGGERGRIDFACILAIQELVNLNTTSGGLDLLLIDEALDSVESLGLESMIESSQDLDKTIIIVSQQNIASDNENVVVVRKENKVSSIVQ